MVISLTDQEREKFAAYLEQEARTDAGLAEQIEKLGPGMAVGAKKYRAEAMAEKIVAGKLRSIESVSIPSTPTQE